MTQEQIIEGNKLIAVFMGANLSKFGDYIIFTVDNPQSVGKINHCDILYHSSWNWLMPVVEKINRDTDCFVTIYSGSCRIHNAYPKMMNAIEIDAATTIESVWFAIIDFITWYNQQPK